MRLKAIDKKYARGLALSGGGAKGFAHLGALALLEEKGLKPDLIIGTSVGSIMGVLYADGYTPSEIKKLFTGREFSEFAEIQVPKSGLFSSRRFRNFLNKHLRAKTFEELQMPLIVVATDLDNGQSVEFSSGSLVDAVLASSSIPILFNPVFIDGICYVDGGIFRNFPVANIRYYCDMVIGVNVSPLVPLAYKKTILNIAERSYHYMFRANTVEDRELCDILIESTKFGDIRMFDLQNVEQISKLGYDAAKEAVEDAAKKGFPLLKKQSTGGYESE